MDLNTSSDDTSVWDQSQDSLDSEFFKKLQSEEIARMAAKTPNSNIQVPVPNLSNDDSVPDHVRENETTPYIDKIFRRMQKAQLERFEVFKALGPKPETNALGHRNQDVPV